MSRLIAEQPPISDPNRVRLHGHMRYKRQMRLRGMLILEPLFIILFLMLLILILNNGVVGNVQRDWHNAADAGALGGAYKLQVGLGTLKHNPKQKDLDAVKAAAIDDSIYYVKFQKWLFQYYQDNQIAVTLGVWSNNAFSPDVDPPNAVRVVITPPIGVDGKLTGITAYFGQMDMPFFERIPAETSSVGLIVGNNIRLIAY